MRLYVVDDGVGLSDIEVGCFTPYVQGAVARSAAQGMGLGLAISRAMAHLMDGKLEVDKRWTGGAALYLELPLFRGVRPALLLRERKGIGREALAPLRIVVIDDDDGARQALADLLSMIAHEVRSVATLMQLKQLDDFIPDLIVSDWHLDANHRGDEAVAFAQLKWPSVVAIFITGDGSPETLHAMSASHIPVLWKPTDIDSLGTIAAQALSQRTDCGASS